VGTILGLRQHKLIALIAGVIALVAAVTGGIAAATSHNAEPAATPKTATVPAELAQHFAVLNSSTPSPGVATVESLGNDQATTTRLDESTEGPAGQFGLNSGLAKEVTSEDVWVIPGSSGVCIHDFDTGSGVCGPISHALAGDITLDVGGDESAAGGGTIYGLAPDGNSMVLVHDASGSTEDVAVEHNVYVINHPGAVSVDLIDGSGQSQNVRLPR
jgi:hypothetical protein